MQTCRIFRRLLSTYFVGETDTSIADLSHARQMVSEQKIGAVLRSRRRERKLTQEALAAQVGISRSHLAMMETGADLPGRDTLVALFGVLDLPLDLIAAALKGEGEPAASATATDEEEALWLHAYRQMDENERKSLLAYAMARARPASN